MHSADTSLGGAGREFPRTTLGFVGALRSPEPAEYGRALEDLARRYWKPVYAYVRAGRSTSAGSAGPCGFTPSTGASRSEGYSGSSRTQTVSTTSPSSCRRSARARKARTRAVPSLTPVIWEISG